MARINGTAVWVMVGLTCVGLLASSIYTLAATGAQVEANAKDVNEMKAAYKTMDQTVRKIDKKVERVLTILEEREAKP